MTIAGAPLHALEISARPPKTWAQTLNAILFILVFDLACLTINAAQFALLLLKLLLPFAWSKELYVQGIRWSKGCFGGLLVLMSQWFAPTKLIITFEREGQGRLTAEEINDIVLRDVTPDRALLGLKLPPRSVIIANHQVYADWWYAWSLTYFMGTYKDVFIVLKKSLKWVPFVGWGMQFFNFIFLARSWASDRKCLASHLASLGREAEQSDRPFSFILYPEGTLVSKDTRVISKKYADKLGIPDMLHTLLPRSTGLLYTLRSLAPRIPTLQLIDITVAYPGIPPMGYGQSYYTLRSIFLDRVPPPSVHMHIRVFDVAHDVPVGNLSRIEKGTVPQSPSIEVEIPQEEATTFDLWLRKLWQDKDALLTKFHENGSFASKGDPTTSIEIPLRLRHDRKITLSFCVILPILLGYLMALLGR